MSLFLAVDMLRCQQARFLTLFVFDSCSLTLFSTQSTKGLENIDYVVSAIC